MVPLTYSAGHGRLPPAGAPAGLRTAALVAAGAAAAVLVPAAALSGGALPPPPAPAPAPPSPGQSSGFLPGDRVPPPWVLPPGADELSAWTSRPAARTPADEEFRSVTTIQSGCRTYVLKNR